MIAKLLKLADDLDKIDAKTTADELDKLLITLANLPAIHPPTCQEDKTPIGWERYHDWIKANPSAWHKCIPIGIQELPTRKYTERYEVKNCPLCDSTLYKKLATKNL